MLYDIPYGTFATSKTFEWYTTSCGIIMSGTVFGAIGKVVAYRIPCNGSGDCTGSCADV